MLKAATLSFAVMWELVSTLKSLSLPIEHNRVKMNFDGQSIDLTVDTGSGPTYLVYGGWYETLYGSGSCKHLLTGCYFCPPTDPCNLEGLLAQEVFRIKYLGNHAVDFVNRKVALRVDKHTSVEVEVGLMVGSTRAKSGIQPYAMLGLGVSPSLGQPPPFLGQLVKNRVIPNSTISIHASTLFHSTTGELILGKPIPDTNDTMLLPLNLHREALGIVASTVGVKAAPGDEFTTGEKGGFYVSIDTGSDVTTVPEEVFWIIWRAIQSELGRDRVDGAGANWAVFARKELDAFIDPNKHIWFRKDVIQRLPVFSIRTDSMSTLEVHLSHHVQTCGKRWCALGIMYEPGHVLPSSELILGAPFFLNYDVCFDIDGSMIGITKRAVRSAARKITSPDSWIKFRSPVCKRKIKRQSEIAWLINRCIGKGESD